MIKILSSFCILISLNGFAQLNSGTPVRHSVTQPVPNSTTSEKSAPPQPIITAPAANPVAPVYPGGEVKAVEIQRQLIFPPTTTSGTQPVQKEPLSPIESTNSLKPNRPQREEASRTNRAVSLNNTTQTINKKVENQTANTKTLPTINGNNSVNKKKVTSGSYQKKKTSYKKKKTVKKL